MPVKQAKVEITQGSVTVRDEKTNEPLLVLARGITPESQKTAQEEAAKFISNWQAAN